MFPATLENWKPRKEQTREISFETFQARVGSGLDQSVAGDGENWRGLYRSGIYFEGGTSLANGLESNEWKKGIMDNCWFGILVTKWILVVFTEMNKTGIGKIQLYYICIICVN